MYMAENSGALVGDAMPSGGQRFGKREEEEGVEDEGEGEGEERGEEEEFGVQKYLEKCCSFNSAFEQCLDELWGGTTP